MPEIYFKMLFLKTLLDCLKSFRMCSLNYKHWHSIMNTDRHLWTLPVNYERWQLIMNTDSQLWTLAINYEHWQSIIHIYDIQLCIQTPSITHDQLNSVPLIVCISVSRIDHVYWSFGVYYAHQSYHCYWSVYQRTVIKLPCVLYTATVKAHCSNFSAHHICDRENGSVPS